MAMTLLGSKDASIETSYSIEKKNDIYVQRKTGRQTFLVMGETMADTESAAVDTPGLPPMWWPGQGMFVIRKTPREVGTIKNPDSGQNAILFEVDVEYDSQVLPEDDAPPISKPPRIRWTSETVDELLERDAVSGDAVVTACNEPILLTTPIAIPVLEITRYENYPFNPVTILGYSFRTNSAVFWGAAAGVALMMPMDVDEETIETTRYAVVTYRIKFHPLNVANPWNARPLHHGTLHRPTTGATPEQWVDKATGSPGTTNLDSNGVSLGDSTPEYLDFARHQTVNFNTLSLGPF